MKLPADPEDQLKRPAYIRTNDAGVPICENRWVVRLLLYPAAFTRADEIAWDYHSRLQYLVAKGAILRKG